MDFNLFHRCGNNNCPAGFPSDFDCCTSDPCDASVNEIECCTSDFQCEIGKLLLIIVIYTSQNSIF